MPAPKAETKKAPLPDLSLDQAISDLTTRAGLGGEQAGLALHQVRATREK